MGCPVLTSWFVPEGPVGRALVKESLLLKRGYFVFFLKNRLFTGVKFGPGLASGLYVSQKEPMPTLSLKTELPIPLSLKSQGSTLEGGQFSGTFSLSWGSETWHGIFLVEILRWVSTC